MGREITDFKRFNRMVKFQKEIGTCSIKCFFLYIKTERISREIQQIKSCLHSFETNDGHLIDILHWRAKFCHEMFISPFLKYTKLPAILRRNNPDICSDLGLRG